VGDVLNALESQLHLDLGMRGRDDEKQKCREINAELNWDRE
jgi:hypothetical protein